MQTHIEKRIKQIEIELAPLRAQLRDHSLYKSLQTVEDIKVFMEHHVFAVWDFMSLLKALQHKLTCVQVPWIPNASSCVARFINGIIHEEESDVNEAGEAQSHFEMYLDAMRQLGANTQPIVEFIFWVNEGKRVNHALNEIEIAQGVMDFVSYTFLTIEAGQSHLIASAFTFGREDVIPDMFMAILKRADTKNERYTKLTYYLQRHIELDGDDHGPLALQMISELCGRDERKWQQVLMVAKEALRKRIALWDSINEQIVNRQPQPLLAVS